MEAFGAKRNDIVGYKDERVRIEFVNKKDSKYVQIFRPSNQETVWVKWQKLSHMR